MAPDAARPEGNPRRIFVIGPPGSGKTTLARALSRQLGLPGHDLDLVFREGGGNGPWRDRTERDAEIGRLAAQEAWIADGIHLDGTEPLMDAADLIVWLDHVSSTRSTVRIVRRFIAGAWAEVRARRGWRRFLRFGDYVRHLRELARAIPETRSYTSATATAPSGQVTRAQVAERLARYPGKVVRCRRDSEVEALLRSLRPAPARSS